MNQATFTTPGGISAGMAVGRDMMRTPPHGAEPSDVGGLGRLAKLIMRLTGLSGDLHSTLGQTERFLDGCFGSQPPEEGQLGKAPSSDCSLDILEIQIDGVLSAIKRAEGINRRLGENL